MGRHSLYGCHVGDETVTLSDVFRPDDKPLGEYNMQELDGGNHYAWCPMCKEPERLLLAYENGIIFACGFMDKTTRRRKENV